MMKAPRILPAIAAVSLAGLVAAGCAQSNAGMAGDGMKMTSTDTVTVGGEAMYPSKNIVQNAVNSKDHTTLVAAVKAAGLADTLMQPGPFTVFAPTNAAFDALPAGTVSGLMKPASKDKLTGVLTYHVVPGRLTAADLMRKVEQGNGKATLKTVEGDWLTLMQNGPRNIVVKDKEGRIAHISTYDVMQSNGVIHVVDTVLLPG